MRTSCMRTQKKLPPNRLLLPISGASPRVGASNRPANTSTIESAESYAAYSNEEESCLSGEHRLGPEASEPPRDGQTS